ncbi:MAG: L-glutamate gamma-semialdehyde dehydrogenase [Bacteroidota bacterium]|nr:L-glutamate gamma-semialdehyde dehydrogenase [Bacteroidota bacterium]
MENNILHIPIPQNEPILGYAPNSSERVEILKTIKELKSTSKDIPMYIGAEEVRTGTKTSIHPPHEINHTLGHYYYGGKTEAAKAIKAALHAKSDWENMPWEHKAAIFMKAADLVSGKYRYKINAATMLAQSKSVHQAEIDAVCELADFLRFNVYFANEIYKMQPVSATGVWNRTDYRPLEGFIYALTPFNFTAIAGNLPAAPAIMGNVVVWKPADQQVYTAALIMEILYEAGLPKGVINLIYGDGPEIGEVIFKHPDFAGLHFTGSTQVFKLLWKEIAKNIDTYETYPRIVGETGGKDFVLVHDSANVDTVVTALIRGAFEYQGQKCSAASRAYIPATLWNQIWVKMKIELDSIKVGPTDDLSCFINAVIDAKAFDKITGFIERAKNNPLNQVIFGGKYDSSEGYFIQPTVILTSDPHSETMENEIFGPVLTIFVYNNAYEEILKLVNNTSKYALTGAIIATDKSAQIQALDALRNAAGNIYINDKPTGAIVGQQPFGGARQSGTNDKSGSLLNMLRWVSPRTIKEVFVSPIDYRYPFLNAET